MQATRAMMRQVKETELGHAQATAASQQANLMRSGGAAVSGGALVLVFMRVFMITSVQNL